MFVSLTRACVVYVIKEARDTDQQELRKLHSFSLHGNWNYNSCFIRNIFLMFYKIL